MPAREHPWDQRVPRRRIRGSRRRRELVAAVEEERFTRLKHDTSFPHRSIRYCLETAGLEPRTSTTSPFAEPPREPRTTRDPRPEGPRRPAGGDQACLQPPEDPPGEGHPRRGPRRRRVDAPREAALRGAPPRAHRLVVLRLAVRAGRRALDRRLRRLRERDVGRRARATSSQIDGEVTFPHSLGVFYTAVTQYLGFPKYGDEYKVMGLASYGEPRVPGRVPPDRPRATALGSSSDLDYFRHHIEGVEMTWDGGVARAAAVYSGPRWSATSARPAAERPARARTTRTWRRRCSASRGGRTSACCGTLHERTGMRRALPRRWLALNCVANGKIFDADAVRGRLHPARGARRRHGVGAALLRVASGARPAPRVRDGPRLLGPGVRRRPHAAGAATTAAGPVRAARRALD